jgi:hypothetical protein
MLLATQDDHYGGAEDYIVLRQGEDGWAARHRRQYQCVGTYLRV